LTQKIANFFVLVLVALVADVLDGAGEDSDAQQPQKVFGRGARAELLEEVGVVHWEAEVHRHHHHIHFFRSLLIIIKMEGIQHENTLLTQTQMFQTNAANLSAEAFKAETVLSMMNNCADRCQLRYFEEGISGNQPSVACFKNCVTKGYKLGNSSLN